MSARIIVVGDLTSHGGQVINGSPTRDIGGQGIARVGDNVSCPLFYPGGRSHGVNKIVSGHSSFTVDGISVAIEGSLTECGCTLIGSSSASVD